MPEITVYTDGSCLGNPGPGGWAAILVAGERRKEISGYETVTTNNQMELTAVLKALEAIKVDGAKVKVVTDSEGVIGWLTGKWKAKKLHIANLRDRIVLTASEKNLTLTFEQVKGHSGHTENEQADKLASAQARTAFKIATNDYWCDWCGEYLAVPGVPCDKCRILGAED